MYLQRHGVHLWYFKLRSLDLTEFIDWNISGLHTLVYKDIGIRKWEFVAKTQFLCSENQECKDDLTTKEMHLKNHYLNPDKNSFYPKK